MCHSHRGAYFEHMSAVIHSLFLFSPPKVILLIRTSKQLSGQKLSKAKYTDKILDHMASAWPHKHKLLHSFSTPHFSCLDYSQSMKQIPRNYLHFLPSQQTVWGEQMEKLRQLSVTSTISLRCWVTAQSAALGEVNFGPSQSLVSPSLIGTHPAAFAAPAHHTGPLQAVWQWFSPPPAHH